jgi:hypothetical protein
MSSVPRPIGWAWRFKRLRSARCWYKPLMQSIGAGYGRAAQYAYHISIAIMNGERMQIHRHYSPIIVSEAKVI